MNSNRGDQTCFRKRDDILVLFDVDGTLTLPRQDIDDAMDQFLTSLKKVVTVGLVGGSDLKKISEQTLSPSLRSKGVDTIEACVNRYDYVFAENGLVAYRQGQLMSKQSLLNYMGEEKLQNFINVCFEYMSKLKLPCKRGNFIEFRSGMINVCPVGRSCSQSEREQFSVYDSENNIRKKFIEYLISKFGPDGEKPMDLVYAIGGQISFDVYPKGWDKTFCLNLIDKCYREIHFFGDKTYLGGNDYEIFSDARTIGHTVKSPQDTLEQLKRLNLFDIDSS